MRIVIFGANGMLGSMLFRTLADDPSFFVLGLARGKPYCEGMLKTLAKGNALWFDGLNLNDDVELNEAVLGFKPQVVINCVGVSAQPKVSAAAPNMMYVNSIWPHSLAKWTSLHGIKLIHISSDGVFSGKKGRYSEDDLPDPIDQYGQSKLLGELDCAHCLTLRMSMIGRYSPKSNQLIDWILRQSGSIVGFKNAVFSGPTTAEIASIIRDSIIPDAGLTGVWHIAAEPISKLDLIRMVVEKYSLRLLIEERDHPVIDRSLNAMRFTNRTGYVAPSWPCLIDKLDFL